MEWIAITVAVIFVLLGLVCLVALVLGLPGTWMMLGLAVIIELVDGWYLGEGQTQTFGWWTLAGCALFGGLGELLEFFAGMLGAKKAGSSKRGMIGALVGGLAGAILGTALPAPIIGSLIGAIAGTFLGAVLGELSGNEKTKIAATLKPATGATIGRILGTLSKLPIAMVIWVVLSVKAFWL